MEAERKQSTQRLHEARKECEQSTQRLHEARKERDAAREECATLKAARADAEVKLAAMARKLEAAQDAGRRLSADASEARERFQQQIGEASAKISELDEKSKSELDKSRGETKDVRTRLGAAKKKAADAETRCELVEAFHRWSVRATKAAHQKEVEGKKLKLQDFGPGGGGYGGGYPSAGGYGGGPGGGYRYGDPVGGGPAAH